MAIDTPARIAILGAGPIGLEAALYARYLGYEVDLYERGRVAENVLRWGHARMFSPFGVNRSPLGLAALKAQDADYIPPADDALLHGAQFAASYLIPLAHSDLLADSLHEQTEVLAIGRDGPLKQELAPDDARSEFDFRILLASTDEAGHRRQHVATADVVIDASGTYGNPNWLGHGGIPALGELIAGAHVEYGLADVLGAERGHYAHRRTLLIGAGDSAASSLLALAELASQAADTWVTWATRFAGDESNPQPVRQLDDDSPGERDRVARLANRLAADDANHVTLFTGTTVEALTWHADLERFSVRLLGKHAGELEFDRVIANVGYRADNSIYRELQVRESPLTGGPAGVAASLYDSNGDQAGTGLCFSADSLLTGEPDFYILGAKSFGRDPRFLISTGLEQIRQLFTILGDRPQLDLYATMAGMY